MERYRSIKVKLYPTSSQKTFIENNFNLNRFLWNQLLSMQIERYANGGSFIGKFGMNYIITAMKKEFPFLKQADSTSLLYTSADLSTAYDKFFKKKANFPKFKSRKRPKNSYKSNCTSDSVRVHNRSYIKIPKMGLVRANGLNRIQGKINSVIVKKLSDSSYEAVVAVKHTPIANIKTNKVIGIDLGIKDLAVQSDGVKVKNMRFEKTDAGKRIIWEKRMSRRREQALKIIDNHNKRNKEEDHIDLSNFRNYQKSKHMVAKIHKKTKNKRNDYLQKYTTTLVHTFDIIAIEDLRTKNLMKNRNLSRAIADAGWAKIKSMLEYKCNWYNKQLIIVNPAYTTQMCSQCGELGGKKPLHIRVWECKECGTKLDRDINAAQNIINKAITTL